MTAKGTAAGIVAYYNISIQDSTLIAISTAEAKTGFDGGILAILGDITINNGTVEANSKVANAIDAYTSVVINDGGKVTASGGDHAINGTVKNEIEGTGWSNVAGTEGKTLIAVNKDPGAALPLIIFPFWFVCFYR